MKVMSTDLEELGIEKPVVKQNVGGVDSVFFAEESIFIELYHTMPDIPLNYPRWIWILV